MVRVRLFAALREAAGASEVMEPPGRLGDILASLEGRFGERFSAVLATASVLVDGGRCGDPDARVADGAEIALLPPFSGGSSASAQAFARSTPREVVRLPSVVPVDPAADRANAACYGTS